MTSTRHSTARLPHKRMLPAMLALVLAGTAVPVSPLSAAPARTAAATEMAAAAHPAPQTSQTLEGARVHSRSFKDLGAVFPLQLRGVDGMSGVVFGVRSDEVVASAKLHLNYSYSPGLLPDISHLRVLVNEQVVAAIPVPKAEGGQNLQRVIDIPARLIGDFNRLNIQLIGHYTMECEDPAHSSLWANVGNDSMLELMVNPLPLDNNLAFLPEPFFDRRDSRALKLPIVFATQPDAAQLEAAGTLSSWFGALAGFRGAFFPASVGQLPPTGNAVVLVQGSGAVPGVSLPQGSGPTVTMMAHPSDPTAKLLVISGRDAQELKRAAAAVAVGAGHRQRNPVARALHGGLLFSVRHGGGVAQRRVDGAGAVEHQQGAFLHPAKRADDELGVRQLQLGKVAANGFEQRPPGLGQGAGCRSYPVAAAIGRGGAHRWGRGAYTPPSRLGAVAQHAQRWLRWGRQPGHWRRALR